MKMEPLSRCCSVLAARRPDTALLSARKLTGSNIRSTASLSQELTTSMTALIERIVVEKSVGGDCGNGRGMKWGNRPYMAD